MRVAVLAGTDELLEHLASLPSDGPLQTTQGSPLYGLNFLLIGSLAKRGWVTAAKVLL